MAQTWSLSTIRSKVRVLTGRPSANQISNADIDNYIDNFYRNVLPPRTQSVELHSYASAGFTGSTVAGTGEYALGADVFAIQSPLIFDSEEIPLTYDLTRFFRDYPESVTTQSKPIAGCLFERKLYLRPIADAAYTFRAPKLDRPTSMTLDADEPVDQIYGPAIAYGASIDILMDYGETEEAAEKSLLLTSYLDIIFIKNINSEIGRTANPSF